MSHGHTRVSSKGACIYCGDSSSPLSDEHVVPFALGGQHVIEKASCGRCAKITSRFELEVARGLWGDARIAYNAPTRKKKKPSHITLPVADSSEQALTVPYESYPAPMVFYRMPKAGLLQGLNEDDDISGGWRFVAIADDKRLKEFESANPGRTTARFKHVPDSFGRLLAKIAYGQVLCSLDPGDFDSICVPYILGSKKNLSYIVGAQEELPEPMHDIGYSMRTHICASKDQALLIGEVRLLANNKTPSYHVVVGTVAGEQCVERVWTKVEATYAVRMPDRLDDATELPDELHWMPVAWPLPDSEKLFTD